MCCKPRVVGWAGILDGITDPCSAVAIATADLSASVGENLWVRLGGYWYQLCIGQLVKSI